MKIWYWDSKSFIKNDKKEKGKEKDG